MLPTFPCREMIAQLFELSCILIAKLIEFSAMFEFQLIHFSCSYLLSYALTVSCAEVRLPSTRAYTGELTRQ